MQPVARIGPIFSTLINGASEKKIGLAILKGTLVSDRVPFSINDANSSGLDFSDLGLGKPSEQIGDFGPGEKLLGMALKGDENAVQKWVIPVIWPFRNSPSTTKPRTTL